MVTDVSDLPLQIHFSAQRDTLKDSGKNGDASRVSGVLSIWEKKISYASVFKDFLQKLTKTYGIKQKNTHCEDRGSKKTPSPDKIKQEQNAVKQQTLPRNSYW